MNATETSTLAAYAESFRDAYRAWFYASGNYDDEYRLQLRDDIQAAHDDLIDYAGEFVADLIVQGVVASTR